VEKRKRRPAASDEILQQALDLSVRYTQLEVAQFMGIPRGTAQTYIDRAKLKKMKPRAIPREVEQAHSLASEQTHRANHLERQIQELLKRDTIPVHAFQGKKVKIGIISDTHIGSLYARLDVLQVAYRMFKSEGVKNVYHAGDLVDGEKMYRGQEYEIYAHGSDAQIKEVENRYPHYRGITTYFITGNHDLSYFKRSGTDIGLSIKDKRLDMIYLGQEEADIDMMCGSQKVRFRLCHPRVGTAYALSYHTQKYIESLSGGEKPHIIVFGHTHKAFQLPDYRNICSIQGGTAQSQTPFMRGKNLAAHIGFWILEFTVNEPALVSRFKAEFFPVYEPGPVQPERPDPPI